MDLAGTQDQGALTAVRIASWFTYVLAALSFVGGVLALVLPFVFYGSNVLRSELLIIPAAGVLLLVAGIIYIVCGIFVARRSRIATGILIAWTALGILGGLWSVLSSGNPSSLISLVIPVVYLVFLVRAHAAISALKQSAGDTA